MAFFYTIFYHMFYTCHHYSPSLTYPKGKKIIDLIHREVFEIPPLSRYFVGTRLYLKRDTYIKRVSPTAV